MFGLRGLMLIAIGVGLSACGAPNNQTPIDVTKVQGTCQEDRTGLADTYVGWIIHWTVSNSDRAASYGSVYAVRGRSALVRQSLDHPSVAQASYKIDLFGGPTRLADIHWVLHGKSERGVGIRGADVTCHLEVLARHTKMPLATDIPK